MKNMTQSFLPILLISLTFSFCSNTIAQENQKTNKYGIYGGLNYNIHTADFYKLAGIPNCCPAFESGSGLGFNAGFLYEHKINDGFWLSGRLGLMTLDGILKKNENTTIIIQTGAANGTFEHKLTGSFMNLGLEPSIVYNPFDKVLVSAGARFGLNLTKKFDQIEEIIDPPGTGTFLDSLGNDSHSRTRNIFSGDIPNAIPFQMSLLGSISYELPLNIDGTMILAPEISYYFPITETVQNTSWKISSIRAGIALKFVSVPKIDKEKIFRKEYRIDTVKTESPDIAENFIKLGKESIKSFSDETPTEIVTTELLVRTDTLFHKKIYKIDGKILALGIDKDGNEIQNPKITIEEFVSNRLDPLLNYVFFDNNSYVIPNKYKFLNNQEVREFEIDSLYQESTLDIYYNILNIVGKRLTENPSAKLTLIGCNADLGDEKNNIELSQKRAEAVRDYLLNVWNIDKKRITLEKRNLPAKASTPFDEPDKIAENRRVEFYSDNYEILKPIFIEKIDRTANPPVVRFKADVNAEAGLKGWQTEAYQNSDIDNKFISQGKSDLPQQIDWQLEYNQKTIPKSPEPIVYKLELEDVWGNKKIIDNQTLPINVISIRNKRIEKQGDYEIERYSLILFDFDKAAIEGNNQKIIDFIKNRIKPDSEIEISGYTDRTGEADYNKSLSERRSLSAKSALKRNDAVASGIGEEQLLYNNDLPEGRFYCRTVNIVVKTKVQ